MFHTTILICFQDNANTMISSSLVNIAERTTGNTALIEICEYMGERLEKLFKPFSQCYNIYSSSEQISDSNFLKLGNKAYIL